MRPIKLRIWNAAEATFMEHSVTANGPICLWVGIVDKHGREVYEGDIVEAYDRGVKGTFEVRWRDGAVPQYILWPAYQNGQHWSPYGPKDFSLEVIGNIFETPHLRPRP